MDEDEANNTLIYKPQLVAEHQNQATQPSRAAQ